MGVGIPSYRFPRDPVGPGTWRLSSQGGMVAAPRIRGRGAMGTDGLSRVQVLGSRAPLPWLLGRERSASMCVGACGAPRAPPWSPASCRRRARWARERTGLWPRGGPDPSAAAAPGALGAAPQPGSLFASTIYSPVGRHPETVRR